MTNEKLDLAGITALVTGGGVGIGRAIALTLARHRARIALLDKVQERIETVVGEVEAEGGTAWGIAADITDDSAVEAAIAQIVKRWSRIDVLVNCAGIFDGTG